jgi:hypothetical protein
LHRSEYRYSSHSDSIKMLAKIRMSKSFLLSNKHSKWLKSVLDESESLQTSIS